jgi:uncharacterized protein
VNRRWFSLDNKRAIFILAAFACVKVEQLLLIIQVDEIKDSGLHLEGDLNPIDLPQLKELGDDDLVTFTAPINYAIDVSRFADIIEIKGRVKSAIGLSCGRCLEPYKMAVASSFSLAYTSQLPDCVDEEGEEVELSAEELGLTLLDTEEIVLTEPLQEQVLMAMPIQPLCQDDCQGLCAHCGANLNIDKCGCEEPVFDKRFAALKDFKVNN